MRTVRCSGRLSCHACTLSCMSSFHAHPRHTHHPPQYMPHTMHTHPPCMPPPPTVDRILDTRLWKIYLSATSFADGNKILVVCSLQLQALTCTSPPRTSSRLFMKEGTSRYPAPSSGTNSTPSSIPSYGTSCHMMKRHSIRYVWGMDITRNKEYREGFVCLG